QMLCGCCKFFLLQSFVNTFNFCRVCNLNNFTAHESITSHIIFKSLINRIMQTSKLWIIGGSEFDEIVNLKPIPFKKHLSNILQNEIAWSGARIDGAFEKLAPKLGGKWKNCRRLPSVITVSKTLKLHQISMKRIPKSVSQVFI